MVQRRIFVSGKVQGVFFRASTVAEVQRLDPSLKGYVRNLPDGRVEAVFQGEESSVQAMVEWCRRGPPRAQVGDIQILEEELDPQLKSFDRV